MNNNMFCMAVYWFPIIHYRKGDFSEGLGMWIVPHEI